MPLNSDYKTAGRVFHGFNDTIGRHGGDAEVFTRPLDALVMKAIDLYFRRLCKTREKTVAWESNRVPGFIMSNRWRNSLRNNGRNVLYQRSPTEHIQALHAETDAEYRKVCII